MNQKPDRKLMETEAPPYSHTQTASTLIHAAHRRPQHGARVERRADRHRREGKGARFKVVLSPIAVHRAEQPRSHVGAEEHRRSGVAGRDAGPDVAARFGLHGAPATDEGEEAMDEAPAEAD